VIFALDQIASARISINGRSRVDRLTHFLPASGRRQRGGLGRGHLASAFCWGLSLRAGKFLPVYLERPISRLMGDHFANLSLQNPLQFGCFEPTLGQRKPTMFIILSLRGFCFFPGILRHGLRIHCASTFEPRLLETPNGKLLGLVRMRSVNRLLRAAAFSSILRLMSASGQKRTLSGVRPRGWTG
jgi:hypothetical protein